MDAHDLVQVRDLRTVGGLATTPRRPPAPQLLLAESAAVKGEQSESRRDTERSGVPLTAAESARSSTSGWPPRRHETRKPASVLRLKFV